jgi:hypothetical protein
VDRGRQQPVADGKLLRATSRKCFLDPVSRSFAFQD